MRRSLAEIEARANEILNNNKIEEFKMKTMQFVLKWFGNRSQANQYDLWKHCIEKNYGYEFGCEGLTGKYVYTAEERKTIKELCKRKTFIETFEKYCDAVGV